MHVQIANSTHCPGACHGTQSSIPVRAMTPEEESLLYAGAGVIVTAPLSGGVAVLATTGKAIQLTIQGQSIVRGVATAGHAKALATARSMQVAAVGAFATAAPVISNPTIQQNAIDFAFGMTEGPPPMTPAGAIPPAILKTIELLSN